MSDVTEHEHGVAIATLGPTGLLTELVAGGHRAPGLPLEGVTVTLRHKKIPAEECADCATKTGKVDVIERAIELKGSLSAEVREELLRIAERCPVHRTLTGEIKIRTALA